MFRLCIKFSERIVSDFKRFYYLYMKRDAVAYSKSLGVRIGEKCNLIDDPRKIFGSEPWLIKVGNHVRITFGVRIFTHEGAIWTARGIDSKYENFSTYQPVTIGNNVTIGMYSIIMPGVTIGDNVIIGSHSVVTRDINSNTIVAGVPAKQISEMKSFMKKMNQRELFDILNCSQNEKRLFLKQKHPEWFEDKGINNEYQ